MVSAIKYINIHAHHRPQSDDEEAVVDLSGAIFSYDFLPQYYSYGIHPWYLTKENAPDRLAALEQALQHHATAIGEVGFDKLRGPVMELQSSIFNKVISLSEQYRKPLIIHCVKAWEQLLEARRNSKTERPWIIHGFHGNRELAKQLSDHQLYLSFGKNLLESDPVKDAFSLLPLSKVFLETDDALFHIKSLYEEAAKIKGIPVDNLKEEMSRNFNTVFSADDKDEYL